MKVKFFNAAAVDDAHLSTWEEDRMVVPVPGDTVKLAGVPGIYKVMRRHIFEYGTQVHVEVRNVDLQAEQDSA